ncbi:MAG: hypothetical protein OXD44_12190 [Gammaproteobacteria bacterium]|nr:hypothetical protein [Gammaproteobacteria bacterium]
MKRKLIAGIAGLVFSILGGVVEAIFSPISSLIIDRFTTVTAKKIAAEIETEIIMPCFRDGLVMLYDGFARRDEDINKEWQLYRKKLQKLTYQDYQTFMLDQYIFGSFTRPGIGSILHEYIISQMASTGAKEKLIRSMEKMPDWKKRQKYYLKSFRECTQWVERYVKEKIEIIDQQTDDEIWDSFMERRNQRKQTK